MQRDAGDTQQSNAAFVKSPTFASFFMGGFECSTHFTRPGRRLDLIQSTGHDATAPCDYQQLHSIGLRTVRDGLRWHLVERSPGRYDWSSFLRLLRAGNTAGIEVVWDLLHYGWPDGLDVFSPEFIDRFASFSAAAARVVAQESEAVPFYCPVNEISYFAWAGGSQGLMNPFDKHTASALKRQLVCASIAAIEAVRSVDPRARIVHAEPLINVHPARARDTADAANFSAYQFEAMDMLCGKTFPELGGKPSYLDIIGVNFYPDNQWYLNGGIIPMGHHQYKPLHELLQMVASRYMRPLIISETGAEGSARPAWLHYVVDEVLNAMMADVRIDALCLYPVTDYPGWKNNRLCKAGLLSMPNDLGRRDFDGPLLNQLVASAALLRAATRQ